MKNRYYVGILADATRETFRSVTIPTKKEFGSRYSACIGPFQTKRGAEFMAKYGQGNPHCLTVADAERLAKEVA